jgi:hypothetical protein
MHSDNFLPLLQLGRSNDTTDGIGPGYGPNSAIVCSLLVYLTGEKLLLPKGNSSVHMATRHSTGRRATGRRA